MHSNGFHPLTPGQIRELNQQFNDLSSGEILRWAWDRFGSRASIGTSFQGAGLVIMHLAKSLQLPFPAFTLDTGLLFPETQKLRKQLEGFLGIQIEVVEPDLTVDQQAAAQGPELWKRDPDLCCTLRKVLPLQSRLAEADCWITGLRRQQSVSRADVGIIELYTFDERSGREIVKLNPLANWSREAVWGYIREHAIPYNPLHDQGYRSIGCHPCTSKTSQGENERGGRWLGFNKVECGIHTFLSKKG
jgi:phosphoadenosine phosphosulfate reductase